MNLRIIPRNSNEIDDSIVKMLSKRHNLPEVFVRILVSRGIDTVDAIQKFLYPAPDYLYDPFLLKGMRETVSRLEQAIEQKHSVVLYGDYDADGLCGTAILSLYLSSRGLDVYVHIPSRTGEGYGLNIDTLEDIIDKVNPDLILTCDCGISAAKEVEHVRDLGLEIIVTDHHEVPAVVPDCVVINPKQSDCGYPFDMLCGAGVAFKIVHAMGGLEECLKYADLAAIATVADLVPLTDENRLIVQLGLERLSKKSNIGLAMLLENQELDTVTASDIAYKIAPRINAAGRMGDAYRAFRLFTESDRTQLKQIMNELNGDNDRRKQICDKMYNEAVAELAQGAQYKNRAIILTHPDWEKGITGILAARLTGDFKRPSFVIISAGDVYKGTCRSINSVNLYELLTSVSDLLLEYGGHSQAAGFSIAPENVEEFKRRINQYLACIDEECFMPEMQYDIKLDINSIDAEFVKALEKTEPTGNSNPKPLFAADVNNVRVSPLKGNGSHTLISCGTGVNIYAFNHYKHNTVLAAPVEKSLIFELGINAYDNTCRGVLKAFDTKTFYINDDLARANYIKTVNYPLSEVNGQTYQSIDSFLYDIYGTLFIAGCADTYNKYRPVLENKTVLYDFIYSSNKNNYTRLMISPQIDENIMLNLYERIVFLDSPLSGGYINYLAKRTKAEIFVPSFDNRKMLLSQLNLDRAEFAKYFEVFKAAKDISGLNIYNYFKLLKKKDDFLSLQQFIFCVSVFTHMGFFDVSKSGFSLKYNKTAQAKLETDEIYSYVRDILNG